MASETVKLFSKIEIELLASAQGTFTILTDLPGSAMAQRFSFAVAATSTRRTVTSRLPYNTQGHLIQASYAPGSGQTALYRARVWTRELPGGQWQWVSLPVVETPVDFISAELPIPPTSEAWHSANLPIPPTTDEWRAAPLPIPPTSEEWRSAELPIKPTPAVPEWVELGGDA